MRTVPGTKVTAQVETRFEGWHFWPDAPADRAYLAALHRHMFIVRVAVEVFHGDREIEFHDLLTLVRALLPGSDVGPKSCEHIGADILGQLVMLFPGRGIQVSVLEDGECGAVLDFCPGHS